MYIRGSFTSKNVNNSNRYLCQGNREGTARETEGKPEEWASLEPRRKDVLRSRDWSVVLKIIEQGRQSKKFSVRTVRHQTS